MKIRKLLLCIEEREDLEAVANRVSWFTRALEAEVVLFHSSPPTSAQGALGDAMPTQSPFVTAEEAANILPGLTLKVVEARSTVDVVTSILDYAEVEDVAAILLPTHARSGLDRMVFDSVTERVIRSCRHATLTLDLDASPSLPEIDRVIAPLDLSEISLAQAEAAANLAARLGAPLELVHVVEDSYRRIFAESARFIAELDKVPLAASVKESVESLAGKLDAGDTAVTTRTLTGAVATGIAEAVSDARHPLVVVATAGRNGLIERVLGSTTERLVRTLDCPILALNAKDLGVSGG